LIADQTLLEYAGGKPVRVYTYAIDKLPLGTGDNTIRELNNQHAYVNGNKLRSLPAEFFTIDNVAVPYISFNQFDAIPPEIAKMSNLWAMYWAGNLILLLVCDSSGNRLRHLPEAFGASPIVHQRRLAGNPLKDLLAGFATMPGSIEVTGANVDIQILPQTCAPRSARRESLTTPAKRRESKATAKRR